MALGGMSDRSGNQLLFQQNEDIIFSDEGSDDQFMRDIEDDEEDEE